jgi:hypothetical protein
VPTTTATGRYRKTTLYIDMTSQRIDVLAADAERDEPAPTALHCGKAIDTKPQVLAKISPQVQTGDTRGFIRGQLPTFSIKAHRPRSRHGV